LCSLQKKKSGRGADRESSPFTSPLYTEREEKMMRLKKITENGNGTEGLLVEDKEDRPLLEIVESLVRRNRTMARSLEISLEVEEQVPTAPLGETGTQVSRIIQEALTNARRHSGAKRISVRLAMDGDDLLVEVSDDGHGFGPETPPGVGVGSMRERAALLGGELEIESEVERGTSVRLRVPLSRRAFE